MTQFIFNMFLIAVQVFILRQEFEKKQLLQIPVSMLFSNFINLIMPLISFVSTEQLFLRWLQFGLGITFMALGITAMSAADIVMLPGDGVPRAVASKNGCSFGKAKVFSDSTCVVITIVLSVTILRRMAGIQIGTLAAALCLGNMVRLMTRCLGGISIVWKKGRNSHEEINDGERGHCPGRL